MTQALNVTAFQKPAPANETKADWQSLDITTLSADLQSAYHDYRTAQDIANKRRKTFEDAMSAKLELPAHLALAFGYKFGRLSVAIVPASRPSSAKPAMSLTDLVKRADRR